VDAVPLRDGDLPQATTNSKSLDNQNLPLEAHSGIPGDCYTMLGRLNYARTISCESHLTRLAAVRNKAMLSNC
jgi:hypothetical protein